MISNLLRKAALFAKTLYPRITAKQRPNPSHKLSLARIFCRQFLAIAGRLILSANHDERGGQVILNVGESGSVDLHEAIDTSQGQRLRHGGILIN